ncbi:hypothetical protein TZ02_06860 [Clostridium aceticum]|nr:hypothetical protein TZ02_06860 [Clostridium aceticum]
MIKKLNKKKKTPRAKAIVIGGLLLALLLLPLLSINNFQMRMIIMVGIYMVLAMSLNLITGYTGQLSLGHAAFYGIGAYTSAILSMRYGMSFIVTAPIAATVSAFAALLLGIPTLKLQGAYFAIVTLGFSEIVRIIALNWISLTRGPMGIPGIARPLIFGYQVRSSTDYYYLILFLVVITYIAIDRIMRSRLGRAFSAIREDELAAQAMGVDTLRYKILSFTIAAFFAGLAGSFYAHYITYIDPQSFTFNESIQILSMVVLGGMGNMWGAMVGTIILVIAPEMLRFLEDYRMVMYGAVLIIMMLTRPQGILGGIHFKLDSEEEDHHETIGS